MIFKIILFTLITLLITGLLATFQQKINLDFNTIILPQLAPMIGFLVMMLLYKDLRIPIGFQFDKVITFKSLLALVLPFCLILISFFIGKLVGVKIERTDSLSSLFSVILIGMLIGSIGEELGWRSFLQPILERKNGVLISSIIVGIIWGMWHIGHYKNGVLFMVGFLIFTVSASIIIAWILRDTEYNIITSTVFHLSVNIGFFTFFKNALTNPKLMLINGFVWLVFAMGIVMLTDGNLKIENGI
ncbi:MAG: hypothetical protein CSA38_04575 [Flavobacteriales bacterium]|nr:MAG: hypothetical protein CSA38_04575 [Flavobacteriales bacterium]